MKIYNGPASYPRATVMSNETESLLKSAREQIAALRRERDELAEQIRQSHETIARSIEMLRRMDAILAMAENPSR